MNDYHLRHSGEGRNPVSFSIAHCLSPIARSFFFTPHSLRVIIAKNIGENRRVTRNIVWSKISIITTLLIMFAFLFPYPSEAKRIKPIHTGKDVKGVTFEDFWARAREETAKWGKSNLRVRRVISLPVVGFDGRNGRSPAWEAQFVRCDKIQQVSDEDENVSGKKTCKGRTITVRLIETGITGAETGLKVSKETPFNGYAAPIERIKISPQRAEDTANSYRHYDPVETDTYAYELKYDQRRDRPVWAIKRTCGYRGKAEGRCTPGDYWIVKVDAESGEVIKPDKKSKPPRVEKIEDEDEEQ
jgi:hypothetical protein